MEAEKKTTEEVIDKSELAIIKTEEDSLSLKIVTKDDLLDLEKDLEELAKMKRRLALKKFTITDINDKAAVERLRIAVGEARTKRTSLNAKRLDKGKPYTETKKFIDKNYNRVIDIASSIEDPLSSHYDEVREKIELQKKQEEIDRENRYNERVDALIKAGASFDNVYYSAGSEEFGVSFITLDATTINAASDIMFAGLLDQIVEKVAVINQKEAEKKLEADRVAKEKKDQEEKEAQRVALEKEKLANDQKALDEEMAEMRRVRIESRGEQLEILGMTKQVNGDYRLNQIEITQNNLAEKSAADWALAIADLKYVIKEAAEKDARDKKFEEEKQKQQLVIKARCEQLAELGMRFDFKFGCYKLEGVNVDSATEITLYTDEEWNILIGKITPEISRIKEEIKTKAEEDAKAEEKRISDKAIEDKRLEDERIKKQNDEELAAADDSVKWAHYTDALFKLQCSEMTSAEYKKRRFAAYSKIEEILAL